MAMAEPQPLPEGVRRLIAEHHRRAGAGGDCPKCGAGCCATSGFALFENVARACELYARGWLSRQLAPGLDDRGFLLTYFDVVRVAAEDCPGAKPFHVFFPRSLLNRQALVCLSPVEDRSGKGRALTLGEYAAVREFHREANAQYPWTCVFLSSDIPRPEGGGRTFTGCLLHGPESATHLTAKPIGCVLAACRTPPELLEPDPALVREWLAELGRHYGPR